MQKLRRILIALLGVTKHEECVEWRKSNALGDQETCSRKVLVVTMQYGDCSPSYDPGTPPDGTNQPYGGGTTISGPGTTPSSPSPTDDIDGSNTVKPIPGYTPKKPVVVIPDEWPGSDEGMPYQWWSNDQWLDENFSLSPDDDEDYGGLTAEEKRLINMYPGPAYSISKNAESAKAETIKRFGNNGRNDKSDAFRHCFFNAMNQRDCGKDQNLQSIARKFGDAHESETPQALDLEKQMDLYNNAIGHIIGDVMFPIFTTNQSLADDAMKRVTDGSLRYLSPRDFTASPAYDANQDGIQDCATCRNGIISATKLTPTNQ